MKTTFRILMLAATLLAVRTFAAEESAIPIPEQRSHYKWIEQQRIQYLNNPLMRRAIEALRARNYPAAERLLREALKNDPGNNHAQMFLAGICYEKGSWEEAARHYGEVSAAYPAYADASLHHGLSLFKAGRLAEAISVYEKALQQAKLDELGRRDVTRQLAYWCFDAGRMDDAHRYAEAWTSLDARNDPLRLLMESAVGQGNWTQVVIHCDALLKRPVSPADRGAALMQRGFALGHLGRRAEANVALEEAEAFIVDPAQRLTILRQRGFNGMMEAKYEEAAARFREHLDRRFDPEIALQYIQALMKAGRWEELKKAAAEFVDRKDMPAAKREEILRMLLYAHEQTGAYAAVEAVAHRLFTETRQPTYLREAARAAEKNGDFKEAAKTYRECLEVAFDPSVALDLHFLLKRGGLGNDVQSLLQKALDQPGLETSLRHALLYELAQVHRAAGRESAYFATMSELLREKPGPRFYREYADQLQRGGRFADALAMYEKSLEEEPSAEIRRGTCMTLADLQLGLHRPLEAQKWLERARKDGAAGLDWSILTARTEYQLENFGGCIDHLLPFADQSAVAPLYLGFSFYRMQMPGLALMYLRRVPADAKLTRDELYNLHANRAFLFFDQEQDAEAIEEADRAIGLKADAMLDLLRVKALARSGDSRGAIHRGVALLNAGAPPVASALTNAMIRADLLQTLGSAALQMGSHTQALDFLSRALDFNPSLADPLYLRGLARMRQGDYDRAAADLDEFRRRAEALKAVPYAYWGDAGTLEGWRGHYDQGVAHLRRAVAIHPADIDSREEAAYQLMKDCRIADARKGFRESIAHYNEVTPYLRGADAEEYERNRQALRKEHSKLDKTFGLQAYVAKTDYDDAAGTSLRSIDGALPAQAGIQGSWRPPEIGFRDERTLDVYGRVLGNFEPDSWTLDADSYQGGVGVVYKPFTRYTFNTSLEKLFKIGDNAEDNWLWRNMASWERGERPDPASDWWWWTKVYGEISYFLQEQRRWIYYLDARLGPSISLRDTILLTVPQVMGTARYQSDDPDGLGTYTMAGAGANLRLFEPEHDVYTERWQIDAYLYYVWGWFDEQPTGLDDRNFDGVILGVNFVK